MTSMDKLTCEELEMKRKIEVELNKPELYSLEQLQIMLLYYNIHIIEFHLTGTVNFNKAYQVFHLPVILKLKLAPDVEKNPGPIHQRLFEAAKKFSLIIS